MRDALRRHWPEYLIEGAGLALFMVSACLFATLLEHPGSPVRQAIGGAAWRRLPMGLAMGLTAIALIYSRPGRRSGAHLNPALTLTFWRLGKVAAPDAVGYVAAQFVGGAAGVWLAAALLGEPLGHPAVAYAVTVPGPRGVAVAWLAEALITGVLMTVVLTLSNHPRWSGYTGLAAGSLVAAYIVLEAPWSGMSMNPARTLGSALAAGRYPALWVYFTAPLAGMLLAAEIYTWVRGVRAVRCAKLHHDAVSRCIFRCGFATEAAAMPPGGGRLAETPGVGTVTAAAGDRA